MIFFMITKHLRLLILASDLGKKGLKNMPPWRQGKLVSQGNQFGLDKLLNTYKKTFKNRLSTEDWKNTF